MQAIIACHAACIPYITLTQLVGEYHAVSDEMAYDILQGLNHALSNVFLCNANIKLASRLIGAPIPNTNLARNPCKRLSPGLSIPFPASEKSLVLACVASLSMVHKGQDNILEILTLPKWRDRDIIINFYGHGPNAQILRRLAHAWDLHNVYFHGYVDSLEVIWSECSALILASHMEADPIVLTEAMLCRRSVIAPMLGTAEDLIQDSKTGFLAKSSNIYHLEEALDRAWANRGYLQQLGENAYQLANERLAMIPEVSFCNFLVDKASEHGIT
jgi:glycosyltransferase involved in cell wall biosynthesis